MCMVSHYSCAKGSHLLWGEGKDSLQGALCAVQRDLPTIAKGSATTCLKQVSNQALAFLSLYRKRLVDNAIKAERTAQDQPFPWG